MTHGNQIDSAHLAADKQQAKGVSGPVGAVEQRG
jgi:hypothetical protein